MGVAAVAVCLVAVVLAVTTVAERRGWSAPLLLTLVGIAGGYLPGVPEVHVPSEVVLLGLLPPLLYAAAIQTSLVDLGANKRNIAVLSVVLVLVTAVCVGLVVWRLLGVPLPIALAFGGIVAPPDAVAATAVARRIGLPRQIVTILEGESLFNDATALVVVRMGLLAAATAVGALEVAGQFVWASVGGIAVGIVTKLLVVRVRRLLPDSVSDTSLSFLVPWLAYLPAESLHCSGVLAVVVTGVLLGHSSPVVQSAVSRMAERITWRSVSFLLENLVFLLIGLQARGILAAVADGDLGVGALLALGAAVLSTVILVRPVVILGMLLLARHSGPLADRMRAGTLASWAGMRGVVTLAAAFTLPEDAPQRPVLVLLALVVVAGTLVLQGFSLPWLARRLQLHGPDPREDVLQAAGVMQRAVQAGQAELQRIAQKESLSDEVVRILSEQSDRRALAFWEQLGRLRPRGAVATEVSVSTEKLSTEALPTVVAVAETPAETFKRIRRSVLQVERAEVLRMRDAGAVDREVLREVLGMLDLEESLLATLAHREAVLDERLVLAPERSRGDCVHLREADAAVTPRTPQGCQACLEEGTTSWVHLRLCLTCGTVGCCDSSPRRHATAHFHATDHPVMRSFEPGEAWRWCYLDEVLG